MTCPVTYDDLGCLPEPLRTTSYIANSLLLPLSRLRGLVFTGPCETNYVNAKSTMSVPMGDFKLEMRFSPQGLISRGQLADLASVRTPIIVQCLTFKPQCAGTCTLAILIPPFVGRDNAPTLSSTLSSIPSLSSQSVYNSMHAIGVSTGARNTHLCPISLFDHHSLTGGTEFPVSDSKNHFAVVTAVFNTHRPAVSGGTVPISVGGISTFYLALNLARASVPDQIFRPSQDIPWNKWHTLTTALSARLEVSSNDAVRDMHSAVACCDFASVDGLIAILSNILCGQMLPDAIHSPDSIPLFIAMALRLAMHPEWYSLPAPTAGDQYAVNELRSFFESAFKPILSDCQGNKYALDLCIQHALKDAAHASMTHGTQTAHSDSLQMWGAVGMHTCVQLFGITLDDILPFANAFGGSTAAECPLQKASRDFMASSILPNEVGEPSNGILSMLAPVSSRRASCMKMLNAVERWLRLGAYGEFQISPKNPQSNPTNATDETDETDETDDEDDALSQLIGSDNSQIEAFLCGVAAAAANHEMTTQISEEERGQMRRVVASITNKVGHMNKCAVVNGAGNITNRPNTPVPFGLPPDIASGINLSAFEVGSNRIAAALCQGTLAMHQMPISTWLAHEEATVTCASCSAKVPLLVATMVSPPESACAQCHRPRCLACQKTKTTKCKCRKSRKK
jgi:hypothetical protein